MGSRGGMDVWWCFLALPPSSGLAKPPRDVRIDFFRGLALVFIFVDHIPNNLFGNWTMKNIGFADAAEIFILLSGYSAMAVFASIHGQKGFLVTAARIWRRAWQLYLAHIFLFVVMIAHVAYLGRQVGNPMFVEEMRAVSFLGEPDIMLVEALLLRFKPRNLDILPLYVVLMLAFPVILRGLIRRPGPTMALSFGLYLLAQAPGFNLPSYPQGTEWFFNPFAWQFLFTLGALLAMRGSEGAPPPWAGSRWVLGAAALYVLFALFIAATWRWNAAANWVPLWMARAIYPLSKTNLDILRVLHILALTLVTVRLVGPTARFLEWWVAKPLIQCGRHSLHVFCLGVFLSFIASFIQAELGGRLGIQIMVVAVGVAMMFGVARLLEWYRRSVVGGEAQG